MGRKSKGLEYKKAIGQWGGKKTQEYSKCCSRVADCGMDRRGLNLGRRLILEGMPLLWHWEG